MSCLISLFLFSLMSLKERAEGGGVAGGIMSSELVHSGALHYQDVQSQFENPYYGVRV